MKNFVVGIMLQFLLFTPFYIKWMNDCKEIGKESLAVGLGERFVAWMVLCPLWLIGLFE